MHRNFPSLPWLAAALRTAALTVLALTAGCGRRPDPSGFNVIVVTLDTTRADRIGAFGGTAVPTPHFDRAAEEGVRFTNAMATAPLTLPSHGSMFTGQYPFRHGVRHNGAFRLPASAVTLAERLRDAGFRTGAFVGAYVVDASFGLGQGFETYSGVAGDSASADFLRPSALQRPAAAVNAAALAWLDTVGDRKFFAWIHYYDPHHPYAPPENSGFALAGSGYDREISYVDFCFGDLVARLRERNLSDRTILVVVGDHGESLGSHGEGTHGLFLYEPALRVPFFVRAPGLVRAGDTLPATVSVADVAPTVLSLLSLPPLENCDGESLLGQAAGVGRRDEERRVYAETWMPRIEMGWSDLAMVRSGRYKFVRAPRAELYDLETDPAEAANLVSVFPDIASDLSEFLDTLLAGADSHGSGEAANVLSPEELAKLRSLGYLRGGTGEVSDAARGPLPDPKDGIEEATALETAQHALESGDLAGALGAFDSALSRNPRNHSALQGRARALLRAGELAAAEDAALTALAATAADPATPGPLADNARGLLATILSLRGRAAEAAETLRSASNEPAKLAASRSPVAVLLAGAKNRDDAEAVIDLAVRLRPRDPWTWAARLELATRVSDSRGAEEAIVRLAALGPRSSPALVDAGRQAQDTGDVPLATRIFREAARLRPDHPDIVGYMGTALLVSGDLEGAERAFLRVLALRPRDPRAPMYLSSVALLRNDEAGGRRWIDEALERDPQFVPPILNYARWLAERGRLGDAVRAAEAALARRPADASATTLLEQLRAASGAPAAPR